MNLVMMTGNLTRDPEVRPVGNSQVAKFTLAVSTYFKKSDGTKGKETVFVPAEIWDTGAKTVGEYVKKGDKLLIVGELKEDKWKDKTSGEDKSRMKVRVSTFEQQGPRRNTENETVPPEQDNNESEGDQAPF